MTSHMVCCNDIDRTVCNQSIAVVGDDTYEPIDCVMCKLAAGQDLCPGGAICTALRGRLEDELSGGSDEDDRIYDCGCSAPCDCGDCDDCGGGHSSDRPTTHHVEPSFC